ncbi:nuclear transport factor 2 family protein [Halomicroarcula sp. GCM10025709]|uniref:nuclear transport factor 2 family protein n=1 Tax=Haloarcula TaxID=2237 RepID=UPI0024C3C3F1|nr:nuclear transport factor 2 family protein [Halomicroarcula sp. YJ-61-S]
MDATARLEAYYDALRAGEPLAPFFAADESVVKFGVSERLVGGSEVAAGLRDQTASTTDWTVESHALRVTDRDGYAWFSDAVDLAWTDTERGVGHDFETRWSGTLERRTDGDPDPDGTWLFVGMHVSVASSLD